MSSRKFRRGIPSHQYTNPRLVLRSGSLHTVSESGRSVYGENVRKENGNYLREWETRRNKLSSAISSGLRNPVVLPGMNVLYLGASFGTGVSHIADLCFPGKVFAVEVAYEPFLKLLDLSRSRTNVYPILDDANSPERYRPFIDGTDLIYQDVSQRNQVQIFMRNSQVFPEAKSGLLVLKLRSISSSVSDREVLEKSISGLSGFEIDQQVNLDRFHRGHVLIQMQKTKSP
ncbi:MAG: fibrillarin-like rRNA/tRNA 2'-O-methyltransferase [Candidatus Thermoplasmatota archaeon]|nr:fibrillarin-like rRNA/tRNA 2'-O-methyltransferase [Candidatus Thermoplasmatota archaeon]